MKKEDASKKSSAMTGGEYVDNQDSPFICPVVGLEMSGKYRFCYISVCGCVVSERALKEVKSETCHVCGRQYDAVKDAVIINGTPEEVEQLKLTMNERREKAKTEKKTRKRTKTSTASDVETEVATDSPSTSDSHNKKQKKDCPASNNKPSISSSSSTTKTSTSTLLTEKSRADYSVAKDPNASETYKSLFTTHSSAKNKPKGNWVTYNPMYF